MRAPKQRSLHRGNMSVRKTVKLISWCALILSLLWFYAEPGYEPVITFLFGLSGLIGSYYATPGNEGQHVTENSGPSIGEKVAPSTEADPDQTGADGGQADSRTQNGEGPLQTEQSVTLDRYCSRCGTTPGTRSTCVGAFSAHDFVTLEAPAHCSRCGVTPGTRSTCVGAFSAHDFVEG